MMNALEKKFNQKLTENGDDSFYSTGDNMLDILFMSEFYQTHPEQLPSLYRYSKEDVRAFCMFIRDPRIGLGRRDLGRYLFEKNDWALVSMQDIVASGRYDDLIHMMWTLYKNGELNDAWYFADFLLAQCRDGNELAKKWMPRLRGKHDNIARWFCKEYGMSHQAYQKLCKANTVERALSEKRDDEINYEHVPSLAMLKYYKKFCQDERFQKYLEDVKAGKKELKVKTSTPYDIYRNADKLGAEADLFFDKLPKVSMSVLPIVDTSASMWDSNDSVGKAVSIAYWLSKNSTYCNGYVVSFSDDPCLIKLGEGIKYNRWYSNGYERIIKNNDSIFAKEINSMYTGDCAGSTNFAKTIELLADLDEYPDWFVVVSDMEMNLGSRDATLRTMRLFEEKGVSSRILWWNFNPRNQTVPMTMDEFGNVYFSGYSPWLLQYLQVGFDGQRFLHELIDTYKKNLNETQGKEFFKIS